VAWQDIRRVVLQQQPVRSKRRYLLILEDARFDEPTLSEASVQSATPAALSDPVVLYVELNDLFLRITPEKAMGLLERIRTEFAVELARYGVNVANGIEAI
jgi:hypothetical protein